MQQINEYFKEIMISNIKESRNEKNCEKNIVIFPGEYGKNEPFQRLAC